MNHLFSKTSHHYLLWLYAFIALGNIVGNVIPIPILVYLTKPLLMSTLLFYFWKNRHATVQVNFQKWMQIGLLFAVFGDTFLMFKGDQFFLLGLGCFFVTHLFYILAFLTYQSSTYQRKPKHLLAAFLFVCYYFLMIYYLWDHLPDFARIHVVAYSTVITLMAIIGVLFAAKLQGMHRWLVITGIVLFIISDSFIAIDKFTTLDFPYPRIRIMLTYVLSQLCLVISSTELLHQSTEKTLNEF